MSVVRVVLIGLGVVWTLYLIAGLALEFVDPPSCGCLLGCVACTRAWARVRRNRRWGRRALAVLGVLAAFALLASATLR